MKSIKLLEPIGDIDSYLIKEYDEVILSDFFGIDICKYPFFKQFLLYTKTISIEKEMKKFAIGCLPLTTLTEDQIDSMGENDMKILLKNINEMIKETLE